MSKCRQIIPLAEAQAPFFVGVDLGGTNVKVGVVDDRGQTLTYLKVPTQIEKGPADASRRMGETVLAVIRQAGLKPADVQRVGLGSPGTMDIAAGMLLDPVNMPGWDNFPLRDRVSQACGLPVTFINDANAAAYGEFWMGSAREWHSMVLLTLGTGVGSGIIIGDLQIQGEHSCGAECGHMIIDFRRNARLCGCGQRGHLEAYASGTAVIQRTREGLQAGRNSSIAHRLARGDELTPKLVAEDAAGGDQFALDIVMETAEYLGIGIVNVMHTFDPIGVVLGGAMNFGGHDTDLGRRFLDRVKQEIRDRAFPVPAQKIIVDYAQLGGDAGYIGAAGAARSEENITACT